MENCTIQDLAHVEDLVKKAHACKGPCVVRDGDDECLVAMAPAVFERILFEGEQLTAQTRSTMHV